MHWRFIARLNALAIHSEKANTKMPARSVFSSLNVLNALAVHSETECIGDS